MDQQQKARAIRVVVAAPFTEIVGIHERTAEYADQLDVCGVISSANAVVEQTRLLQPEVLLLSAGLGIDAADAARRLALLAPTTRLVVLVNEVRERPSGSADAELAQDASAEALRDAIVNAAGLGDGRVTADAAPGVQPEVDSLTTDEARWFWEMHLVPEATAPEERAPGVIEELDVPARPALHIAPEAEPEPEPEAEVEPEPEVDSEPEAEPEQEPEAERVFRSVPEAEPQPEPATASTVPDRPSVVEAADASLAWPPPWLREQPLQAPEPEPAPLAASADTATAPAAELDPEAAEPATAAQPAPSWAWQPGPPAPTEPARDAGGGAGWGERTPVPGTPLLQSPLFVEHPDQLPEITPPAETTVPADAIDTAELAPAPAAVAEPEPQPEPVVPQAKVRTRRAGRTRAETVLVFSGKGGVGKSVVATNLAVALSMRGAKVAVIDLNLQYGDVAVMLHVEGHPTSIESLAQQGEHIDHDFLEEVMAAGPEEVSVLLAPASPEFADLVTAANLRAIIRELSRGYDYVVVDSPAHLEERVLEVMEIADQILVVTSFAITSVKDTKVTLKLLQSLGIERERIAVVLNQTKQKVNFQRAEVERSLRFEALALLPFEPKVDDSIDTGRPLALSDPKSDFSKQLKGIVDYLAPEEPAGAGERGRQKASKRRLFNR